MHGICYTLLIFHKIMISTKNNSESQRVYLTGKEIYWEHFGKMDLPEYAKNAADKLHMYARNGIYPGDRLITTYETMEQPLDTAIVQKLITYHFK